MAEIYPAFSALAINSRVTFIFDSIFYVGAAPAGYLNWVQDPGGLNTLEARDTALFTGDVIVRGPMTTTERQDTAQFNGVLTNLPSEIFPAYSALDIGSQVTFNFGTTAYAGNKPVSFLDWDQAPTEEIFGTLLTIEARDTALFSGTVTHLAVLNTTETRDIALFNGGVVVSGTLTTTETRDTALFNGAVVTSGTLITTEARDIAVFFGSLVGAGIGGNLAFTEASDTASFTGAITGYVGTLTVTENPDTAAFVGLAGDLAGDLNTAEAADTAAFTAETTAIPAVPQVLRFGIPVSLSQW